MYYCWCLIQAICDGNWNCHCHKCWHVSPLACDRRVVYRNHLIIRCAGCWWMMVKWNLNWPLPHVLVHAGDGGQVLYPKDLSQSIAVSHPCELLTKYGSFTLVNVPCIRPHSCSHPHCICASYMLLAVIWAGVCVLCQKWIVWIDLLPLSPAVFPHCHLCLLVVILLQFPADTSCFLGWFSKWMLWQCLLLLCFVLNKWQTLQWRRAMNQQQQWLMKTYILSNVVPNIRKWLPDLAALLWLTHNIMLLTSPSCSTGIQSSKIGFDWIWMRLLLHLWGAWTSAMHPTTIQSNERRLLSQDTKNVVFALMWCRSLRMNYKLLLALRWNVVVLGILDEAEVQECRHNCCLFGQQQVRLARAKRVVNKPNGRQSLINKAFHGRKWELVKNQVATRSARGQKGEYSGQWWQYCCSSADSESWEWCTTSKSEPKPK